MCLRAYLHICVNVTSFSFYYSIITTPMLNIGGVSDIAKMLCNRQVYQTIRISMDY